MANQKTPDPRGGSPIVKNTASLLGRGVRVTAVAAGAPVGAAVGVALAARGDRSAAGGARPTRAAIDGGARATPGDRLLHQTAGGAERFAQLLVGELDDRPPGIEPGGEAGLALEDVADAGDQPLVEQGVAQSAVGLGAERPDDSIGVEAGGEDGGGPPRQPRGGPQVGGAQPPQRRPAELDGLHFFVPEHGPGGGPRLAPALSPPAHLPRTAHAEGAVEDEGGEAEA